MQRVSTETGFSNCRHVYNTHTEVTAAHSQTGEHASNSQRDKYVSNLVVEVAIVNGVLHFALQLKNTKTRLWYYNNIQATVLTYE